jgi:hypothetical protein
VSSPTVERLVADIGHLTLAEQLDLIEQLARQIRSRATSPEAGVDELERMASDPDIQREIAQINAEFAPAENDGLANL